MITSIASRIIEPAIDQVLSGVVGIYSGLSANYENGIYKQAVALFSSPLIAVANHKASILLLFAQCAVLVFFSSGKNDTPRILGTIALMITMLMLLIGVPQMAQGATSHKIKVATFQQLEIIKPYTDRYDQLRTKLLLVRGKSDYEAVWSDMFDIAKANNVILPTFEGLRSPKDKTEM
ncbi:hypothetical protein ACPSLZ_23480 [Vibrio campbellii]|uniref:hypothetical protein n=1 Tax=Vibrio campbellii TaxID=680 RepID=UPI003CE5A92A